MSGLSETKAVPFVTSLRSRPGLVRVGGEGIPRLRVRVELPEQWDTIAFDAPADLPALALKRDALEQFGLAHAPPEDFVLKLRGFEVLDESVSLAGGGARDGSTYLLTNRRRRPVR
jgi:hypothetical protein